MPMRRYRLVLAGGDRTHQEQYARHFRDSGRCDIVAVTDAPGVSAERHSLNAALAARFSVPHLPLAAALELPSDIASICAGMTDRASIAIAFAAAGRHLYLDKPLAASVADARAIAAAVNMAGVTSQIFSQATTTWGQALKHRFDTAEPGAVRSIHMRMLVAKGPSTDLPVGIRLEHPAIEPIPAEPVKREMFDLGYYPVALLDWVVGRPVRSVTAITANHFFREHLAADVDDYGSMLVEFEGGLLASVVSGRVGWNSHPGRGYIEATLLGRHGHARFSPDSDQIVVQTAPSPVGAGSAVDPMGMWDATLAAIPPTPQRPVAIAPEHPAADILAFLDHLDRGTRPAVEAGRGVHHLAILEAAYRSAHTGRAAAVRPGN